MPTTDAVAERFEAFAARGHEPLLQKVTATLRFEVVNGARTERWSLIVHKGDLAVTRRNLRSDVVIRAKRPLLERVLDGQANAVAAMLRGELIVEGSPELLVQFQRLLPRPGDSGTTRRTAGRTRRTR